MRFFATFALLCAVSLAFAAPALALDDVILADGRTRKGQILEVLEDGIRVRFTPKGGGTAEMKVPASMLDPHYFYNLRDEAVGDDAKGHLKLALWAYEAGLFSRAKLQVEKATKLDPQLVKDIQEGKLPDIREGIAKRVLASAEEDIEKGRFDNAETKLEALLARMPDTEAGTNAREVYQDLHKKMEEYQAKKEQEEMDRLAEEQKKQEEEIRRKVKPIKEDLEKGKKFLEEGLVEDDEAKALSLLKRAIDYGEAGLKKIDKLLKDFPDDQDLQKRGAEVKEKVIAAIVKAYVNRADIYIWRGAVNTAEKELDKAREIDPDDPSIEAAAERAEDRNDQDALELRWQRNRREGMRFRSGSVARGGMGGGRR